MLSRLFIIALLCSSLLLDTYVQTSIKKIQSLKASTHINKENTQQEKTDAQLEQIARDYIDGMLGGKNTQTPKLVEIKREPNGMKHIKFQETLDNVPILGEDFIVHMNSKDEVYLTSGVIEIREGEVDDEHVKLSKEQAEECALKEVDPENKRKRESIQTDLAILPRKTGDILVYSVLIDFTNDDEPDNPHVFINANECKIELMESKLLLLKDINVYDSQQTFTKRKVLKRSNDTPSGNSEVDECYETYKKADKYYREIFGRNSWNNKGAIYPVSVRYGVNYNNAFYSGGDFVFGTGDGNLFKKLCTDLDVVAHEIGHGVVDSDSGLVYSGESGALNESFADCMAAGANWYDNGKVITDNVFRIGEVSYKTAPDALRDMKNPMNDNNPDHYDNRYTGGEDNGGVHWNSGIVNLAFYSLSQGGTHPRGLSNVNVTGIGILKALNILYRANDIYYTSTTNFMQARDAWIQAARDLYGENEAVSVSQAWALVGVGSPLGSNPNAGNSGVSVIKLVSGKSTDYLQVSQIACFDQAGNNVTKGKPVTGSAPHGTSQFSYVTDGVEQARPYPSIYHSAGQGNQFISINLGANYNISYCVYYNRSECCNFRIIGSYLQLINSQNKIVNQYEFTTSDLIQQARFPTGERTRFVKIQAPASGDHYLQVAQLACFDSQGNNVTRGKTVTASPQHGGAGPNFVTDGVEQARDYPSIYHSIDGTGAFINIDLGQGYVIDKCVYYNRKECCQFRIIGCELSLINEAGAVIKKHTFSSDALVQTIPFNQKKTRFVTVKAAPTGDHYLQIAQLACFDSNGTNIAKGKPVTASAPHGNATADHVTDGVLQARPYPSLYHSIDQNNAELTVDFGGEYVIDRCEIYNRSECCAFRIQDATVTFKDSNKTPISTYKIPSQDAIVRFSSSQMTRS